MSESVSGISSQSAARIQPMRPQAPQQASGDFKQFMLDSLSEVNSLQQDADKAVEMMMTGGDVNPAEVLTAVQKADLAFRTMMQIRNKLVQAYEEVKQIRV